MTLDTFITIFITMRGLDQLETRRIVLESTCVSGMQVAFCTTNILMKVDFRLKKTVRLNQRTYII